MSRKSLKKKNSDILRLKILLEDKEIAKEELDIGNRELIQILKDYSHDIKPDQQNKFNKFFFGSLDDDLGKISNCNASSSLNELIVHNPENDQQS